GFTDDVVSLFAEQLRQIETNERLVFRDEHARAAGRGHTRHGTAPVSGARARPPSGRGASPAPVRVRRSKGAARRGGGPWWAAGEARHAPRRRSAVSRRRGRA